MTRKEWLEKFERNASNGSAIAIHDAEGKKWSYATIWQLACTIANGMPDDEEFVVIQGNENHLDYCKIIAAWQTGRPYVVLPSNLPRARKEAISKILFQTNKDLKEAAYIVFTSGTTGEPKGVPIYWDQLSAFLDHYLNHSKIYFKPMFNWLQTYALNFDVSVFSFATCFATEGTLHLLPNKGIKFMKVLSFLEERKINVISNVPTTARLATPYLKEFDLNSIKYTFFSGEALYPYEAKAWMEAMPKAMHFNAYGPTETTIVCSEICLNDLSEDYFKSNAPLPIGIPFEGTNFQIEKNELIIEGDQVFQGYINEPKKRIDGYQSGDLVEVDENGQYIFKGRKDDQVQIQGYRVELLEVENCIQSILNKPSVCFFLENTLVAAIETDVQISEQDLSSQIGERLPDYMIPKRYFQMKYFPLNSNQKLDRIAILNRIKQGI